MIGLPPSEEGTVQLTVALAFPAVAEGVSGAVGTVDGVTWFEVPAGPSPAPLVATTVKEYFVPLVKPVTVQERSPLVVQVKPPGDEVTV